VVGCGDEDQPCAAAEESGEADGSVAEAAIPIFAALGRQRKKSSLPIILGRIAAACQLAGGRGRAMRGEVILMSVRSQVIERVKSLQLIPFGDGKFSQSKNSCNNHINFFIDWNGLVQDTVLPRNISSFSHKTFSFSKNGKIALVIQILVLN
jgi:hypothetical protein